MAEKKVQDSSEVIENEELSGFLKDLLELVKKVTALMLIGLLRNGLFTSYLGMCFLFCELGG